ncbi:N-acetylmannosamine-6-phosphate 2-epimerase [Yersinia enterocolitica]|uniref:N-acetylmannosamine-6-phosphate 2-epimerase n=1 Tax=Yersinia enterocolitica TaxID=630 RepID=UPI0009091EF8|nr:putative N-acetylmannosamine-6-phosphate 2-epimerase [Yersinia enterocolitica]PNM21260.1 putative N-acetylmannosamine-6-phosphate 2-epimerase [Yersinia enterocolitica]RLZ01470.1 putative N-acetylmannosamine-6-phosphate 2-epimerase [Yersinia enterocolitica]HDL7750480.1 putative N-acetylmannosamine-6-phosphate 2-epimerase [Yersinia enterocolitica]HDL7825843.1 putative N-acetylmannosamine-6-phosphate 2-epimerase [Yersinia enterocolitica]HDL7832141.1 putative N-acetylmannosamine-6-phosphate 2-e
MNVTKISRLRHQLQNGLIASCQPVPGSAMDTPEIVAAMALAALAGGAVGLRVEGISNIEAVRRVTDAPIIGIIKRDLPDSEVRITPWLEDVDALSAAGADIIAFDVTCRPRPVSVEDLFQRVQATGCLAMADASNIEDGLLAYRLGIDFIGTTLSGYTQTPVPTEPDLELVKQLSQAGCKVIAEGRYNSPALAAAAISAGAYAVTVGSAITRIEHICSWFCEAIQHAPQENEAAKLTSH